MIGELYKIRNEHKKRTDILAENDYYDSDDDTYLDRTGQIEKNRELRKRRAEVIYFLIACSIFSLRSVVLGFSGNENGLERNKGNL